MQAIKIKLNAKNPEHRNFIKNGNIDPITQKAFEYGDRVIVRAQDNEVWLYDSWVEYGDHPEKTLVQLPKNKAIRIGGELKSAPKSFTVKRGFHSESSDERPVGHSAPLTNSKKYFQVKRRTSEPNREIQAVARIKTEVDSSELSFNRQPKRSWWRRFADRFRDWF